MKPEFLAIFVKNQKSLWKVKKIKKTCTGDRDNKYKFSQQRKNFFLLKIVRWEKHRITRHYNAELQTTQTLRATKY